MSQQIINIGTVANDDTGDSLRVGGDKINDNFTELYAGGAALAPIADDRLLANISGGSAAPVANTLTAILDATVDSTAGAFLVRTPTAWESSNDVNTSVLHIEANPVQFQFSHDNEGDFSFISVPTRSAFDLRWEYTGTAPVDEDFVGPSFYLTVTPSTDVDNHSMSYNGIAATCYSDSDTVLGHMIGGRFAALRVNTTGVAGSTNPVIGVTGVAVMGTPTGKVNGDGSAGGLFTSVVMGYDNGNIFHPLTQGGAAGVVGRVHLDSDFSPTLSARDNVGAAGYCRIESNAINAYAGWFGNSSVNGTIGNLVVNNYGVYVTDMGGAKNLNMAVKTGLGTVQFGGSLVPGGGVKGNISVTSVSAPVISSVGSGCTGQFGCSAGGTKTYSYKVVAVFASGATSEASNEGTTTTGFDNLATAGQNNLITWTPVEGAVVGYRIYRTAAGGTTTNTTGLIATVAQNVHPEISGNPLAPTTPSYADIGAVGDSAVPPAVNTTGNLKVNTSSVFSGNYIEVKKNGVDEFTVANDAGDTVLRIRNQGGSLVELARAAGGSVILSSGQSIVTGGAMFVPGALSVRYQTAPPAGGSSINLLSLSNVLDFGIYWGTGVPTVAAAQGSLYLRRDGSSSTTRMYVNTDGGTTWTSVATAL